MSILRHKIMFEKLTKKALKDKYFWKLFLKIEKNNAFKFFKIENLEILTEKECIDLLRFADIFSHSQNPEAKNLSYKIISLLVNDKKDDKIFKIFATAILAKLGNFPALKFLSDNFGHQERLPFERGLERKLKEEIQKVPSCNKIFTDSQYEIFEALKDNNHFSFSGPTSLGKSFIIDALIRHLISTDGKNLQTNIVILVPTKALITQTVLKLKNDLGEFENYKILPYPVVPDFFKRNRHNYIFVFTPERLISYFSNHHNNPTIEYLFIDEAQKITAEKESRSPLYYHVISQARRRNIKTFFASPNIPNPDIFLKLFGLTTDKSLSIKESPVSQNKYFLNLIEKQCFFFAEENGSKTEISIEITNTDFFYWLDYLGTKDQNIIYCNSIKDTINFSLKYAEKLSPKNDPELIKLIKLIEKYLHKDYFLIECLKKGIAFHFGKLPQQVRERVEKLFKEKIISHLFCTSTLLEGVNLPAQNIFILSNKIAISKFTDIDFWNLAGRAGRLTQDMSGNIICMRVDGKGSSWDSFDKNKKNPEKDIDIIKNKYIKEVISPFDKKRNKKNFQGIEISLNGKNLQCIGKTKVTRHEREIWHQYANIALIQEKEEYETIFKSNFEDRIHNAKDLLKKKAKEITVPSVILSAHSSISAKYQDGIFKGKNFKKFPKEITNENSLDFLNILYGKYNWVVEESSADGRQMININPKIKNPKKILKYYAFLMVLWMNSESVGQIISKTISHYKKNKKDIFDEDFRESVLFDYKNKKHINILINKLLGDIDMILRFKLEKYFNNYYLLLKEKLGEEKAGPNWAEFLEYGTTDRKIIELQNIGFSRHLAKYIIDNYNSCLNFENGILENFDHKKLESEIDKESDEYEEYKELF